MPILDRIRRIARANITQLLNQAEAPEAEVEAKIRELEEGAVEAKNALANFAVTYKRLEKNVNDLLAACEEHQRRAELALEAGDDASARRSLSEKLKSRDRLEQLTPVLESRRETYDELKDALVEIHDQLNQARARLMDLRSRRRAADAERVLGGSLDRVRGPEGESFNRLEEVVDETEARVEVDREIRGELNPRSVTDTLRDREVENELEALKKQIHLDTDAE
jgi:phage shock protein A